MAGHSVQLWITTPSFAVNSSFQSFFVLYNRWLWHRSYLDCLSVQSQAKFHKPLYFNRVKQRSGLRMSALAGGSEQLL